jgi:hypothetical protein
VLHVGDRHIGAGHLADLPRIAAGRVDHVLAQHVALVGEHLPLAAGAPLDVHDPGAAHDGRAHVARALGQGVAAPGRIDVPVVVGPGPGQDPLGGHERIDLIDFFRIDDLHLETDQLGHAGDVMEPFDLLMRAREADAAAAVPADVLAGQLLQLGIQAHAVIMDLGHVVVGDEVRALPGRVPGGAGGQLALLDQQTVGPAFLRQVVEQAGAHHPAADDHDPRVRP